MLIPYVNITCYIYKKADISKTNDDILFLATNFKAIYRAEYVFMFEIEYNPTGS